LNNMNESALQFNDTDCQREKFGDDLVLLNFKNGTYINATGSGNAIIDVLINGVSANHLLNHIANVNQPIHAVTQNFMALLIDQEILTASARPLNQKPIVADFASAPKMQIFDDMADLIKADPIHDSDDSMGWPLPKPAE
jgi:hypothetical protein